MKWRVSRFGMQWRIDEIGTAKSKSVAEACAK